MRIYTISPHLEIGIHIDLNRLKSTAGEAALRFCCSTNISLTWKKLAHIAPANLNKNCGISSNVCIELWNSTHLSK